MFAAIPADSQTAISLRIYKHALIGLRLLTVNLAPDPTDNPHWGTHTIYVNRFRVLLSPYQYFTVHAITDYKLLPAALQQTDVFTYPHTHLRCAVKTGNLLYARQSNTCFVSHKFRIGILTLPVTRIYRLTHRLAYRSECFLIVRIPADHVYWH